MKKCTLALEGPVIRVRAGGLVRTISRGRCEKASDRRDCQPKALSRVQGSDIIRTAKIQSMIPKSGHRFSEKIVLHQ